VALLCFALSVFGGKGKNGRGLGQLVVGSKTTLTLYGSENSRRDRAYSECYHNEQVTSRIHGFVVPGSPICLRDYGLIQATEICYLGLR
jgi:hypothetical protein